MSISEFEIFFFSWIVLSRLLHELACSCKFIRHFVVDWIWEENICGRLVTAYYYDVQFNTFNRSTTINAMRFILLTEYSFGWNLLWQFFWLFVTFSRFFPHFKRAYLTPFESNSMYVSLVFLTIYVLEHQGNIELKIMLNFDDSPDFRSNDVKIVSESFFSIAINCLLWTSWASHKPFIVRSIRRESFDLLWGF